MPAQARIAVGWQYALADLSLILFMVCAAALAQRAPARAVPAPKVPVLAGPAAIWRDAPGRPSLAGWLAGQRLDPRQRLTILCRHSAPGGASAAFARADAALRMVPAPPRATRIVVEPGAVDDVSATLTWDAPAR